MLEAQNIGLKCLFGELQYIMDILLALCVSKYRHGFDNLMNPIFWFGSKQRQFFLGISSEKDDSLLPGKLKETDLLRRSFLMVL